MAAWRRDGKRDTQSDYGLIMYSARHNVRYCSYWTKPPKIHVLLEHLANKNAVEIYSARVYY